MLAIQNKKKHFNNWISYLRDHITAVVRKLTTWDDLVGLELSVPHRQAVDFRRNDLEVVMVRLMQFVSRIHIPIHGINFSLDIIWNTRLLAGNDPRTS